MAREWRWRRFVVALLRFVVALLVVWVWLRWESSGSRSRCWRSASIVGDCAKRTQLTDEQVRDLVRRRTLRRTRTFGVLMVEPAIFNGYVT